MAWGKAYLGAWIKMNDLERINFLRYTLMNEKKEYVKHVKDNSKLVRSFIRVFLNNPKGFLKLAEEVDKND